MLSSVCSLFIDPLTMQHVVWFDHRPTNHIDQQPNSPAPCLQLIAQGAGGHAQVCQTVED